MELVSAILMASISTVSVHRLGRAVSARNVPTGYRRGGFVYTTESEKGTAIIPTGENNANHGQLYIHPYAYIGDPYVLPETIGRNTADDYAPSQSAERNSALQSPSAIPARHPI